MDLTKKFIDTISLDLYRLHKDQYVCVSIKKGIWYKFEDHRWKCEWNVLRSEVNKLATIYFQKISDLDGEKDSEEIKLLTKFKCSLYFKSIVLKQCQKIFYDKTFMGKLDENPYLICFENGVYDIDKVEFRAGRPDDYISISTGFNYELDSVSIRAKEIEDQLKQTRNKYLDRRRSGMMKLTGSNVRRRPRYEYLDREYVIVRNRINILENIYQ